MVRPAENARLLFDPRLGAQGCLILQLEQDDIRLRSSSQMEFRRMLRSSSEAPQRIATVDESTLWMFREEYFWADEGLTQHEVHREIGWSLRGP
jgi:hypothetical protein